MAVIAQVTIPEYVISGVNGGSQITATGLPVNGSVLLAFLISDPGVWDLNGYDRQMIVFNGGSGVGAAANLTTGITHNGGANMNVYSPSGWAFVG